MSSEESGLSKTEETPKHEKPDISKLLAVIPPASEVLGRKQKLLTEKRIRIKYDKTLNKPIARIPTALASELGIRTGDLVEIVVAGKKKARFTAEIFESAETNIVHVYPVELEKQGVADNSIATIRKCST